MPAIHLLWGTVLLLLTACQSMESAHHNKWAEGDALAIAVDSAENREFSYTDKKSGYYYATTHSEENNMWFAGWNIAGKRIFADYRLYLDNSPLDRRSSDVRVFPHQLQRTYPKAVETFSMLDDLEVLAIQIVQVQGKEIGFSFLGDLLVFYKNRSGALAFSPKEIPECKVIVTTWNPSNLRFDNNRLYAPADAGGFLIAFDKTEEGALAKITHFRENAERLFAQRKNRLDAVAHSFFIKSDNDTLDRAVPWIGLTLDQLITRQQGAGIYAGLPWFNQYWGRDMFISFPGACLVSGNYAVAKEILLDFAKFQLVDKNSRFYGRIPNRAQPTDIIYNTTDGTPRFVIQILEYVKYSGDTSIIRQLYPHIKRTIEGSLMYWVDENGFLTHDDADTWMDAKKEGKTPYSPRGNRANDIQALWHEQLLAGAFFADFMGDQTKKEGWSALAKKVKSNFSAYFLNAGYDYLADRLTAEGLQDFKLRPNQLYALDLLDDENQKAHITKKVWENLVYPWGVASLSQNDPDFYPYHEHWHYYHKDAAYHNGTVWLWNNGMAMQRLIEAGQTDLAYELFRNMNRQALYEGAVGSLSENADALPRPGATWAKRSGTFLQAWSNAEQLRIWHQYFLGVRPNLLRNEITIQPHIPGAIKQLRTKVKAGTGELEIFWNMASDTLLEYRFTGFSGSAFIDISPFHKFKIDINNSAGCKIAIRENTLYFTQLDNRDKITSTKTFSPDPALSARLKTWNELFKNTGFAKPYLQPNLKSLQNYHEVEITY